MIGLRLRVTRVALWGALAAVSFLAFGVSAASASTAQEEDQGAEVLRELESGTQCAEFGNARHEAMDETLARMMSAYRSEAITDDNGFDGPSAAAMVGMMAVLIGAVAVVVLWLSRRRLGGPLDTLKRRYAAGEMTSEEYEERRRLLEGS